MRLEHESEKLLKEKILQIIGKYMDEETVLNVGEVYEQSTEWRKEKPNLSF